MRHSLGPRARLDALVQGRLVDLSSSCSAQRDSESSGDQLQQGDGQGASQPQTIQQELQPALAYTG